MVRRVDLDNQLGGLLSRHVVDNRRRLRTGFACIALAAAGVAVLVLEIVLGTNGKSFGRLAGLALCAIAAGALVGVPQLVRAIRNGLREVIRLHDGGVAREIRGTTRYYTWQRISAIRPPTTVATQWVGAAFQHSSISFTDGTRLRVDRMTEDGAALMATVTAKRPNAVVPPQQPTLWQKIVVWPLAVTAFACAAGGIYLIWYINTHDGVMVEIAPNTYTEESSSASLGTTIAVGMLVAIVGLILTTVGFVTVYRNLQRWKRGSQQ